MKVAVRYYTKTGNTKRLAEAIAAAAGTEALPISTPVTEQVDVLFLGNSYYAFTIDPEVRTFVRNLDKDKKSIYVYLRALGTDAEGQALLANFPFEAYGVTLTAIYDIDPAKWNEEVKNKVDASKVYAGEVFENK